MGRMFPTLFAESNAENLFVVAAEGKIISHVGMTLQRAALGACTVGVACIGAVATYEEYRGRGLATQLMELACDKAKSWGADFMMISGGRGLYRRLGAADVGLDYRAEIGPDTASALYLDGFVLEPFSDRDLSTCVDLSRTKPAHFLRTLQDWQAYTHSGFCMCREVEILLVRRRQTPLAYCVVSRDIAAKRIDLLEFAGDAVALAVALPSLMSRYEVSRVGMHLQTHDVALQSLLAEAGASLEPVMTSGTYLLLDVERLLARMQPFFETRVGYQAGRTLRVRHEGERFHFSMNGDVCDEILTDGKAEAAELIFGSWKRDVGSGLLGQAFPIPSLWYGLNYV